MHHTQIHLDNFEEGTNTKSIWFIKWIGVEVVHWKLRLQSVQFLDTQMHLNTFENLFTATIRLISIKKKATYIVKNYRIVNCMKGGKFSVQGSISTAFHRFPTGVRPSPHHPSLKMAPKSAGKNGKVAPEKKKEEGVSNGAAAPPGSNESENPVRRSFFHKYIFPGPLHNFKCRYPRWWIMISF